MSSNSTLRQRLLVLLVAFGGEFLALLLKAAGPARHALDRGIVRQGGGLAEQFVGAVEMPAAKRLERFGLELLNRGHFLRVRPAAERAANDQCHGNSASATTTTPARNTIHEMILWKTSRHIRRRTDAYTATSGRTPVGFIVSGNALRNQFHAGSRARDRVLDQPLCCTDRCRSTACCRMRRHLL